MAARRYGIRPSSLMPEGFFAGDLSRAQFDICVAMKASMEDIKARLAATARPGVTTNRHEAQALAQRARAQVFEMEEERRRRG